MICQVKPYEGQEPFIFFSYCHDDEQLVYPIIEQMGADGYRIWYDDGIHPGEDWPEVIARHIADCAVCVAAVTSRSVESHNCRNEITFVVNENKPFVPIILENFQMSLGVKLQLGSGQYIVKYSIPSESDFFTKLYQAQGLEACWGRQSQIDIHRQKQQSVQYSARDAGAHNDDNNLKKRIEEQLYRESEERAHQQAACRSPEKSGKTTGDTAAYEPQENRVEDTPPKVKHEKEPAAEARPAAEAGPAAEAERAEEPSPLEWDVRAPIRASQTSPQPEIHLPTPKRDQLLNALLVRWSDGRCFPLPKERCTIGRDPGCTVFLDDRYVEWLHAEIIQNRGSFFVLAHKSVNSTALNGTELRIDTNTPLHSPAILDIAGEPYMFLAKEDARRAESTQIAAYLESVETGERRALGSDVLELGRNHVWENGTLSDMRISHEHGRIVPMSKGGYGYEAHREHRTNGTYYNHDAVEPGEHFLLCDGDILGLGKSCNLTYHSMELHKEA